MADITYLSGRVVKSVEPVEDGLYGFYLTLDGGEKVQLLSCCDEAYLVLIAPAQTQSLSADLVESFMQHRRATSVCWDLSDGIKRLLRDFLKFQQAHSERPVSLETGRS